MFQRLLLLQQEVLSSPSSTDSSCDSGVCMSAVSSSTPTPALGSGDKTPAPLPPPRTSVPAPPPRQVRFQCEPTKCLEYARDNKTDADVGEAGEEDVNKKKVHCVTFAETECKIREFVPDQQLVNIKL